MVSASLKHFNVVDKRIVVLMMAYLIPLGRLHVTLKWQVCAMSFLLMIIIAWLGSLHLWIYHVPFHPT